MPGSPARAPGSPAPSSTGRAPDASFARVCSTRTRRMNGSSTGTTANMIASSQKSSAYARSWAWVTVSRYSMATARRSAVNVSAPCAMKWLAQPARRSRVS